MMTLFERWCFEWGRVGRVHAMRTALGMRWDTERQVLRERLLFGTDSFKPELDFDLLARLAHAGVLKGAE